MARGKAHSDQTKAAVMAGLLAGMGIGEVAKTYKIPKATAAVWARQLKVHTDQPEQRARANADIAELLVDCVREILTTVAVQSRFARSESWVKEQTGADLAAYQGTALDRVVRILSALEPAEEIDPGPAGD